MSVTVTVPEQRVHGDTGEREYRAADQLSGEWVHFDEGVGEVLSVHVYRDVDPTGVRLFALTVVRCVDGVVLSIPTYADHQYLVATEVEVAQARAAARARELAAQLRAFAKLVEDRGLPGPARFLPATLRIQVATADDVAAVVAGIDAERVVTRGGVEAWWPKRPTFDFPGAFAAVVEARTPIDPDPDGDADPQGLGYSRLDESEPEPAKRGRVPGWLGGGAIGHPPGRCWPRQEGL